MTYKSWRDVPDVFAESPASKLLWMLMQKGNSFDMGATRDLDKMGSSTWDGCKLGNACAYTGSNPILIVAADVRAIVQTALEKK